MATKGTYPFNLEEYKQFKEQLRDLDGRVLDGQVDIPRARQLLQVAVRDQFDSVQFVDRFVRYAHLLLSLEDQLALLREYNEKYWGGVITEDMFAAVDTTSEHVQRVENLELLYVEFGSAKETFENWVAVIRGENPRFWRGSSLDDGYKIRRLARNTQKYSAGYIHRIRINLAADWNPTDGNSVDDSRNRIKGAETKDKLAHGEVFAAYALHTELLQATDGTNLPYFDAPGYEVKPSGGSEWRRAPYGRWIADDGKAHVSSYRADDRGQSYAAPVVWES